MARKKNSDIVKLREKKMANGNIALFLDWFVDGVRNKEYLKLYLNPKARTTIEKENNKRTLELAKNIRLERETQVKYSNFGKVAPTKAKITFFAFAENYKANYTKKDIRMISGAIERFRDFLTERRSLLNQKSLKFTQIDKVMMIDFVSFLEDKGTGEGAVSYYKRFKKIINRAVDEEIISKSPATGIICKSVEGLRKDILTNDEIIQLAKTPCQNLEIKKAFLFCCSTGLRFVDVKALQYKDIDLSSKRMTIDQKKTGKIAIIDLNTTALKMIGTPQRPDNYVFELPTSNGTNKTLQAWVKRAGIEKYITWHCARHSLAVNLLTSEAHPDIKTVSSTLGHSSLKHTEKYLHVVNELKKKAVNSLPEYEL